MTMAPPTATAAFYERGGAVGLLRGLLRASERVWPALAVRLAKALFLTPLPPRWARRGRAWGPGWHVESMPFEGASLTLYHPLRSTWPGDVTALDVSRPQVLLLHGWAGHGGQLRSLADALADAGLNPVVVEMPAHGRSAGWQSSLPQFARALDFVTDGLIERGGCVRAVVAHSLGGAAAAHAMARGLPADRLVLVAAPDAPCDFTFAFARVFGLSERTRASMQRRIESSEGAWMSQFDAGWSGPRVTRPTLVLHDEGDRVNVVASARRLAALIVGSELHLTRGLGHRRILEDADVLARICAFVSPSPST